MTIIVMKPKLTWVLMAIVVCGELLVGCGGEKLATFVNAPDNLPEVLARNYTNFSFQYPRNWSVDPETGQADAKNFVKVVRILDGGEAGKFTLENLAVGWFPQLNPVEDKEPQLKRFAQRFSEQVKPNFPEYQKISEGKTKIGDYEGYEFRFTSVSRSTPKGDIQIWGRVVFLPRSDTSGQGVILIMLASSLAPELKGVEDVGEKGELPIILKSFRWK
jgi:hypothetical protein